MVWKRGGFIGKFNAAMRAAFVWLVGVEGELQDAKKVKKIN
jgi:hypothetical protein